MMEHHLQFVIHWFLSPASPAPLLVEIGTEELPPGDLEDALAQLKTAVPALLDEQRLTHGEIKILGTPRRLVVSIEDLAPAQPDREELVKGPPASRAFDSAGAPTKAAEGFARSKGVAVLRSGSSRILTAANMLSRSSSRKGIPPPKSWQSSSPN